MKKLFSLLGILMGLFAAMFLADRSLRFAKDNVRRYIDIDSDSTY
jgi:hypothetical protein